MKVIVQNPIQSLQTFWCHINRGRSAALPLIPPALYLLISVFILSASVFAQQDTPETSVKEKRLDLLFDQIMETLPDQERSHVDSAAAVNIHRRNIPSSPSLQSEQQKTVRIETRLRELPEDLKIQVERTIADMEERKEERKAQFRESRLKREK